MIYKISKLKALASALRLFLRWGNHKDRAIRNHAFKAVLDAYDERQHNESLH